MSLTALLEPLTIPTYPLGKPEKNPLFFEKRVYQGSCGKVYPVPFVDKVHDTRSMSPISPHGSRTTSSASSCSRKSVAASSSGKTRPTTTTTSSIARM